MPEDARPEPKPDAPLPPIAGKAKDLEALRAAVVDAANVSGALWFSYLFVMLYLIVSVGSVTHRNLFFETAVKLPFLGVELPLVGFFTLGPLIFLVVHAYVLLHFAMLADKVGAFHAELQAQIADDDIRTRLRRQLPSNIFVQFLAGPRELRTGLMGLLLRLIALISLVVGPLVLLVFFQIQFLPYHHEAVTWWQRIAIVLDLALLWALWPSVARGETTSIGWRDFGRVKVIGVALASAAIAAFSFGVATFPGEWLNTNVPAVRFIPGEVKWGQRNWVSAHEYLFAGKVDMVTRRPTSLWSNRLVLPGLDVLEYAKFDSEAKIAAASETFSLRDRHLEGAVLLGARLRKVDFTAARLNGAALDDADVRDAKFECAESEVQVGIGAADQRPFEHQTLRCAQLREATLDGAQLQGARFTGADLKGASLRVAQLQGASFVRAILQEAVLAEARLQGASLDDAQLERASLDKAQLQGASLENATLFSATLERAQLQGASLKGARLRSALLDGAQLQGASLESAWLENASLRGAQLHGASLENAALTYASLDPYQNAYDGPGFITPARSAPSYAVYPVPFGVVPTQLQGANLKGTGLYSASMTGNLVWKADIRVAATKGAYIADPDSRPKYRGLGCSQDELCDWSAQSFANLKRLIEDTVPAGTRRDLALARIESLDPDRPTDGQADIEKSWTSLTRSSPTLEAYQRGLADNIKTAGCYQDTAPYELPGLVAMIWRRLDSGSELAGSVAAGLLDPKCDQAANLTRSDRYELERIRERAPKPPAQSNKQ